MAFLIFYWMIRSFDAGILKVRKEDRSEPVSFSEKREEIP